METFNKRLLAIIDETGMRKAEFARQLEMKPTNLSAYTKENGSVFGGELIAFFAEKFPQFNILWLLTGKGDMYNAGFAPLPKKSEPSELLETIEELRALVTGFNKRIEMLESYVFRKADQLMPAGKSRANSDRKVPVLSALPNR